MIYTVTLNPSLDATLEVEELLYDDANRIAGTRKSAAGKGIDVSRVIRELGGQSIALGFAGGYRGLELEGALISEGIVCDFTKIHEETKTSITVYQRKKKVRTLLSAPEPSVTSLEQAAFLARITEVPAGSFVALSGALPQSVSDSFYAQIIVALGGKGVKVILDADGAALKMGVGAGPFLVKPNIHEFGRLVERNILDAEEIMSYAKKYTGVVEYMVVSMGTRGVVGFSGDEAIQVIPPKVKVRSSMGAGDSLVAGMVFAMSAGAPFEEALILGVACGTASTLNQENGRCSKENVYDIQKDIVVKKIGLM